MCGKRLEKEALLVDWVFNRTIHAGAGLDLNEGPTFRKIGKSGHSWMCGRELLCKWDFYEMLERMISVEERPHL